MNNNTYNDEYFKNHDFLDLHLAKSLKIFINDHNIKKVLDVGCGTGRIVKYLNDEGINAKGCDSQTTALKFARRINYKNTIKQGNATKLPYNDKSFDLIISTSVIEHLTFSQNIKFLKEAYRVLNINGYLFIITPNWNSPFRLLQGNEWFALKDSTHKMFFSPNTLKKLLIQYHFYDIKFRFKSAYNVDYQWYLPNFAAHLPKILRNLLTWLVISSPLSTFSNNFWASAKK